MLDSRAGGGFGLSAAAAASPTAATAAAAAIAAGSTATSTSTAAAVPTATSTATARVGCGGGASADFAPFQAASVATPPRQRFYVELTPGETTFVSWKKLLRDAQKPGPCPSFEAPAGAHPALESRIAPEVLTQKDPLSPSRNRFSSVIERIEKLYQGGNSDDEYENAIDYVDDDKYDTRDSFIDDEDLNDYVSVEEANLKHKGFYVNRGKLEHEIEPDATTTISMSRKRKRKDIKKLSSETIEDASKKLKSGVRLKAAARKAITSTRVEASFDELACADAHEKAHNHSSGHEREAIGLKIEHANIGNITGDGPRSSGSLQFDVATSSKDIMVQKVDLSKRVVTSVLEQKGEMINGCKGKGTQRFLKEEDSVEILGVTSKKLPLPLAADASPGRAKCTVLERALQDLEREVAQLHPPSLVVREPDQSKRNRLPRDIKQKLAKVARLAAKQGKITDDLIGRLMGILGHVIRVRTLKRHLKAMIQMGLSAMQEKEGRLQDIKTEVTEMIKSRLHMLQAQDAKEREGSSHDFQSLDTSTEKVSREVRYQWDDTTENKICDLYEQYIEGLDENRGPHIRKWYAEMAELWPEGWMDNVGIKLAVHRAKERKKKQVRALNSAERRKRGRSIGKQKLDDLGTQRVFSLEMHSPAQDQLLYDKIKTSSSENKVLVDYGLEQLPPFNEDKRRCDKKVSSSERKRSRLEVSPNISNAEKVLANVPPEVMSKSMSSSQGILAGSGISTLAPATPLWNMDRQPGAALPDTE